MAASAGPAAASSNIALFLEGYRGKRVSVILTDGRHILGTLASYDHFANIVVAGAIELEYTAKDEKQSEGFDVTESALGTLMLRGSTVASVGLVNTAAEAAGSRE